MLFRSSSPVESRYAEGGADYKKTSYSGGVGIRDHNMFVDLGYIYSQSNEFFQPYTLNNQDVPGVKNSLRSHNFTVTFGVKF